MFIIKIEKIFLLITTVLFVGCANPPRMIRGYDYSINKYETLEILETKNKLTNLVNQYRKFNLNSNTVLNQFKIHFNHVR